MQRNLVHKFKTEILLIFASTITIVPAFLLLITSSWSDDDYHIAKMYQYGLDELFERIYTWSPRFFSEIVLYLYYNAVPVLGKPMTGAMLLIIWLFLICSIFIFTKDAIEKNSLYLQQKSINLDNKIDFSAENIYLQFLLPLLITLILLTYLFYAQRPNTMFYLVVVSAAYVSALAGIILNINFLLGQGSSTNINTAQLLKLIVFGTITASAWEIGAIFQLLFSSCIFLLLLLSAFTKQVRYLPFSSLNKINRWKLAFTNLIPFLISIYILFLLLSNRASSGEKVEDFSSPLVGNFKASFIAAILQFLKELFFFSNSGKFEFTFFSFSYALILKLSLLVILIVLLYRAIIKINIVVVNACILSVIILIITNFAISFSSYYQLGTLFVPRQANFKSALIGLIIFLFSLIITSSLHSLRNKNLLLNSSITLFGSFCLTFILLINSQLDNLKTDLTNFQNLVRSNTLNWQANLNSPESFAVYTQVPSYYSYRIYIDEGFYPSCNLNRDSHNIVASRYLEYFNKQRLYVTSFKGKNVDKYYDLVEKKIADSKNQNQIDFNCFLATGNVEFINNLPNVNSIIEVKINEPVEVLGWAINPDGGKAKRVLITREDDKAVLADVPINLSRPDVARYLDNTNLIDSGWKAILKPNSAWKDRTINFRAWVYDPDTKTANFYQRFAIHFSSQS